MHGVRFSMSTPTVVSALVLTFGSGCVTVIPQDQVGVRDTFGQLSDEASPAGLKMFFWPIRDITRLSVRTVNLEVNASLPSQEGLTIGSDVSSPSCSTTGASTSRRSCSRAFAYPPN